MSEEHQPFLPTPSISPPHNTETPPPPPVVIITGRQKATTIILLLTLSVIIPQTIVAVQFNSISLLADSLCMSADAVSYLVSIIVFFMLYSSGLQLSARQNKLLDLSGAFIGFLLLVGSATYITVRSTGVVKQTGTTNAAKKQVDGKWGVVFSIVGGVTDALCVLALFYFSDPVDSVQHTKGNATHGSYSYLSVVLHLGADVIRLFGLLVCGIVSLAQPKTSAYTDAVVSLVICGVMYLMSFYLLWKLVWLSKEVLFSKHKEKVDGDEVNGGETETASDARNI